MARKRGGMRRTRRRRRVVSSWHHFLLLALLAAESTLRRQRENNGKTLRRRRAARPDPASHGGRAGLAARDHLGPQARRGRRGAARPGGVPGLCLRVKWRRPASAADRLARLRAL